MEFKKEFKDLEDFPLYQDNDFWIIAILMLFLLDKPEKKEKEPTINIYLGGDKNV